MIRYPEKRTEYNKVVGQIRVNNLARVLKNLGFEVSVFKPEHHGVDMLVWKEGDVVLIIEVLNWKRQSYLDVIRAERIIDNLDNADFPNARKLLIYSFNKNIEDRREVLEREGIDLLEIGFQTQPVSYYNWFLDRDKVGNEGRRPNNRVAKRIVRRRLRAYLEEKNLV